MKNDKENYRNLSTFQIYRNSSNWIETILIHNRNNERMDESQIATISTKYTTIIKFHTFSIGYFVDKLNQNYFK